MEKVASHIKSAIKAALPRRIRNRITLHRALRKSDVFLVGHPKSGNTWLAFMLAVLIENDREERVNISNVGEFVPTIHNRDLSITRYRDLHSPRIFRTEAPNYPQAYPKTIYIVRDPRAALLSYYHHCVHDTGRTDWPISDFVDEMIDAGCIKNLEPHLVRWDRQVEAWLDRARHQPVSMVKYEDLKGDCLGALRKLGEFIGLDHDEGLLQLAVERGDFSRMRKDEQTFGAESYAGEKGERGFFVRKGKVDSWKEEMPAAVVEKIETRFHPVMKKLGYIS
jgi:hypothetical protein